jgi:hypothetical protein
MEIVLTNANKVCVSASWIDLMYLNANTIIAANFATIESMILPWPCLRK